MTRVVEFSDPLTLRTVEDAFVRLEAALSEPGDLEIDCAAVSDVDLSGAQLLVSAAKTAVGEGRGVRVIWPSSGALQRTLSRAGLVEAFERLLSPTGVEAGR
jgi:anti-anti-sigma regulatory factor